MTSNYNKLGPFIRQIDVRNINGIEENLLGVSTQKVFIKSIANTVGTNFNRYKVVKQKQFVYVPDTSRRGDKIGLAMLEHLDEGIVSQAYTVFEVVDHNKLDPNYLMMWFRRPEFDRYARFKSHGSVREIFGWDEMCDVELPIPDISEQKRIVKEYKTITDRIKLNKQLNSKLEESALTIYKQWFIDFEFPMSLEYAESIGKPELTGQPYRSSGGQFIDTFDGKEMPVFWTATVFADIATVASGKSAKNMSVVWSEDTPYPVLGAGASVGFCMDYLYSDKLLVMGRVGTHGVIRRINDKCWPSDNTLVIQSDYYEYTYQLLKSINYDELNRGGVQALITQTDIKNVKIILPDIHTLIEFERLASNIFFHSANSKKMSKTLSSLGSTLQEKMSKSDFAL